MSMCHIFLWLLLCDPGRLSTCTRDHMACRVTRIDSVDVYRKSLTTHFKIRLRGFLWDGMFEMEREKQVLQTSGRRNWQALVTACT